MRQATGMDGGEDRARFAVGQVVRHLKFGYRGAIVDVDPVFGLSEAWYEAVARSRPPKDAPWYHILVSGADHMTYVAERHLEADASGLPIESALAGHFFAGFENGRYRRPAVN